MRIDPSTIAALLTVALGAVAAGLFFASLQHSGSLRRALQQWSAALLLGPIGWTLMEWAGGWEFWWLPGKVFVTLSCVCYLRSVRHMSGWGPPDSILLGLVALVAGLTLLYALLWPLEAMRTAFMSLVCGGLCLATAVSASKPLGLPRTGARIVIVASGVAGVLWLLRAGLLYLPAGSPGRELMTSDLAESLSLGLAMLVPSAGSFGVLLMGNDRLLDRLAFRADHDPLTGALTRGALLDRLARLSPAQTGQHALLLVDIDEFKSVNDRFGHDVGDHALREVFAAMGEAAGPDALLARFGGDEFVVVLPDCSEVEAERRARTMNRLVSERPLHAAGQSIGLRISVGAAMARDARNPADWIKRADQALYEAKRNGRNEVRVSSMRVRAPLRAVEAAAETGRGA